MSANEQNRDGKMSGSPDHGSIRDGIDDARAQVADVVVSAREGALNAIGSARTSMNDPSGALDSRPLTTVLGGVALGVLVGALLPRTERETEWFGALGRRLQDGARDAAGAAKQAGQQKFADLGLDRDNARDTARGFVEEILAAASSAGVTAFTSGRPGDRP